MSLCLRGDSLAEVLKAEAKQTGNYLDGIVAHIISGSTLGVIWSGDVDQKRLIAVSEKSMECPYVIDQILAINFAGEVSFSTVDNEYSDLIIIFLNVRTMMMMFLRLFFIALIF